MVVTQTVEVASPPLGSVAVTVYACATDALLGRFPVIKPVAGFITSVPGSAGATVNVTGVAQAVPRV